MNTANKRPDRVRRQTKCENANRHMTYAEYGVWELYRGLAASPRNKTGTVAISNENMARLFKGGSRQVVGRIIKSLVAAGWLETVQTSKYIAEHQRTPIEYRALSHEDWAKKYPGACSDLNARNAEIVKDAKAGDAVESTMTATPMTMTATQATVGGTEATMTATPMTMTATEATQTATPITNVSLCEPIKELISNPIKNLIETSNMDVPTDGIDILEDFKDFDTKESDHNPTVPTEPRQDSRQEQAAYSCEQLRPLSEVSGAPPPAPTEVGTGVIKPFEPQSVRHCIVIQEARECGMFMDEQGIFRELSDSSIVRKEAALRRVKAYRDKRDNPHWQDALQQELERECQFQ